MRFMGAGENKCITDMLCTIRLWHASWNKKIFKERSQMWIFLSDVERESSTAVVQWLQKLDWQMSWWMDAVV